MFWCFISIRALANLFLSVNWLVLFWEILAIFDQVLFCVFVRILKEYTKSQKSEYQGHVALSSTLTDPELHGCVQCQVHYCHHWCLGAKPARGRQLCQYWLIITKGFDTNLCSNAFEKSNALHLNATIKEKGNPPPRVTHSGQARADMHTNMNNLSLHPI